MIGPFFKLSKALEKLQYYNSEQHANLKCWAKEISANGTRIFYLCSYNNFFKFYTKLNPSHKSFYEIITQYSKCKLYFDIEFIIPLNKTVDGKESMKVTLLYI